jgi:hypothetical protein
MDCNRAGTLYALDANGNEWTVDPCTAAVTLIGNTGSIFWLDMAASSCFSGGGLMHVAVGKGSRTFSRGNSSGFEFPFRTSVRSDDSGDRAGRWRLRCSSIFRT